MIIDDDKMANENQKLGRGFASSDNNVGTMSRAKVRMMT